MLFRTKFLQSLHCSGLGPVQPIENSLWQMYGWDSGVTDWGSGVFVPALLLGLSLSELAIEYGMAVDDLCVVPSNSREGVKVLSGLSSVP